MSRLSDSAYVDAVRVMQLTRVVSDRMIEAENVIVSTLAGVDRAAFRRMQDCLDEIHAQAARIPLMVMERQ